MNQVTNDRGYLGLLSRRRLLQSAAVGGFGIGVAALIGCGDDDDDDAPAPAAATAAPAATAATEAPAATATAAAAGTARPTATAALQAATPTATAAAPVATKHGGFLQFIQPAGYQGTNIDPYYTDTSVGINTIMGKMFYESLLNTDFSNQEWRSPYSIVPWLAESWEQADDVTYALTIRGGVKFHNGATLTADDVGFTYERATAEDANRNNWTVGRFIDGFEVVNENTIRLTAPGPNAEFLEAVNSYISQIAIMPRSAEAAGVDFSSEAVGTGPFRVKDWQADSTTTVTRFEDYWGGGIPGGEVGRPYLDGLRITPGDDATQSASFIAGELDILSRNDRIQAKPILDAVPEAKTVGFPSDYIYGIGFNWLRPPFGDIRVRQAVHLAISRQDVDAAANFGDGVISGPMTIQRDGYTYSSDQLLEEPGFRAAKEADRAEAAKLFAAAGFADGFAADLVYNTRLAVAPVYGEAVQPQLKEVLKLDLTLVPMDTASYGAARRAQPADIDGLFVHLAGGVARPSTAVAQYHSSSTNPQTVGWNDPALDALIDQGKVEFDDAARGAIFQKVEQAMIDAQLWASISAPSLIRMWQPWINDWRDNRAQRQSIMNPSWIWMDVETAPENRLS